MKWLALISVIANLALGAVLLRPRPAEVAAPTESLANGAPSLLQLVTNTVTTVHEVTPKVPRFDWSDIESDDYEVYMANLRRLEMPEWLIRELVIADLHRYYRLRAVQLPAARTTYWLTHREQRARQRQRAQAEWALKEEEHDVMRRLTSTYRHQDGAEAVTESEIAITFGAMTEDQVQEVVSELAFVNDRAKSLEEFHGGLLNRADRELLTASFNDAKAGLATRVSPALIEEFYLRLQIVLSGLLDDLEMPGLQLTGVQLRELVRIRSGIIDPIRWELTEEDKPESAERTQLNQEVQIAVAAALGENVGAQYARSQNPAFRSMTELAERHQLPVERAIVVYDIRQTTIDELRSLLASNEVDDETKWEMRQFIQQETERAIQSTLGPPAWEEYRANDGRWMDRVGGQPPGANVGGGR